MTDDAFRAKHARTASTQFARRSPSTTTCGSASPRACSTSPATPTTPTSTRRSRRRLDSSSTSASDAGNRLYYLAMPPTLFAPIVEQLAQARGSRRATATAGRASSSRSRSAATSTRARSSTTLVTSVFDEQQIYRIDHYLGKETVQNILVLRFANSIFEPLWNRKYIDHVQITVAEAVGVGARGGYYEEAGALRDMIQNHLLQLVCAGGDGAAGRRSTPTRCATRRSRCCRPSGRSIPAASTRSRSAPSTAPGFVDGSGAGLPRGEGRQARVHDRDVRGAAARSTTGAGRACRSTCAPASGCPSA